MNELDFELLLNPPILTKESKIKKYMAAFSEISTENTMNKQFKEIRKIIYIHSFYNPCNPAFNINFLYEASPKTKCDWFKYVLPDDITRAVKNFFDYLKVHDFLKIALPNNERYDISYLSPATYEASIFTWNIPQNFMPFFCAFVFTLYDCYKKKRSFSSCDFFTKMLYKLEHCPTIDYTNVENTAPLVTIKDVSEKGSVVLRFNINSTQQSFMNLFQSWLSITFPSDLLSI